MVHLAPELVALNPLMAESQPGSQLGAWLGSNDNLSIIHLLTLSYHLEGLLMGPLGIF